MERTPPFNPGDRIELVAMAADPDPIPPGTTGTVEDAQWLAFQRPCWQVTVKWDVKRSLSLCIPPDRARKIG